MEYVSAGFKSFNFLLFMDLLAEIQTFPALIALSLFQVDDIPPEA